MLEEDGTRAFVGKVRDRKGSLYPIGYFLAQVPSEEDKGVPLSQQSTRQRARR